MRMVVTARERLYLTFGNRLYRLQMNRYLFSGVISFWSNVAGFFSVTSEKSLTNERRVKIHYLPQIHRKV